MTGPLLPPRVARALSAAAVPPPLPRSSVRVLPEWREADGVDSGSSGSGGGQSGEGWAGSSGVSSDADEDDDPLALPFLIQTWLGGTGALVAPGTAAFEAAAKQAASAKQRAEAAAATVLVSGKEEAAGAAVEGPLLPDDNGVIYVNLGRMPQLDKWQLVTILQALSSPSEAMCWGGGGSEDRLGPYRILWVLPAEQREQLLSALLPMAPPPSFRLKVLGGLPHLGVSEFGPRFVRWRRSRDNTVRQQGRQRPLPPFIFGAGVGYGPEFSAGTGYVCGGGLVCEALRQGHWHAA